MTTCAAAALDCSEGLTLELLAADTTSAFTVIESVLSGESSGDCDLDVACGDAASSRTEDGVAVPLRDCSVTVLGILSAMACAPVARRTAAA